MDYKEKYEAALERAKHIHEVINDVGKKDIEAIFPELSESEDEKIRKFIVETIFRIYGDSQEYLDALAYLEKQKEQKPADIGITLRSLSDETLLAECEMRGLNKPAEWSEEDKRAIDRACVALRAYSNGDLPEFLPSELLGYADRLQSLRPSWKPCEYTLSLVKKIADGEMLTCVEQMAMGTLYEQLKEL